MAYRVDFRKLERIARESHKKIQSRITVSVSGGVDYSDEFSWAKSSEFFWAWPKAVFTEVSSKELLDVGIVPGLPILYMDGFDTTVLSEGQLDELIQGPGSHTLRIEPSFMCVDNPTIDDRSRSPRGPMSRCLFEENMGKVLTSSGELIFNTTWAGIDVTDEEAFRRAQRAKKFGARCPADTTTASSLGKEPDISKGPSKEIVVDLKLPQPQGPLAGSCTVPLKAYSRSCRELRAEEIRPLSILKVTIDTLCSLHSIHTTPDGVQLEVKDSSDPSGWLFISDQLRSVRQDIVVQSLHDPRHSQEGAAFTLKVYGLNIRWALAAGDLGHLMQCIAPMRELLGAMRACDMPVDRQTEMQLFTIKMMHAVLTGSNRDQHEASWEALSCGAFGQSLMSWATSAAQAYRSGNVTRYFALRQHLLNGSGLLKDGCGELIDLLRIFDDRVRLQGLQRLCQAVQRGPLLRTCARVLGFAQKESDFKEWCCRIGGIFWEQAEEKCPERICSKLTLEALKSHSLMTPAAQRGLRLRSSQQRVPYSSSALYAMESAHASDKMFSAQSSQQSASASTAAGVRARARARKQKRTAQVVEAPCEPGNEQQQAGELDQQCSKYLVLEGEWAQEAIDPDDL